MRSSAALAYRLLFFLSGATGLVYQVVWIRVLYHTFGSTIQSVATVVAAYMGGLGLGAWWLGSRADRHTRPAALYGWIEIAVGVYAILSPLILGLAHWIYIGVAGALGLGGAPSVALRFGLAALVLLVPTTMMGATLPILTRAFMGADRERLKPELGRLYGINTLGAMVGTGLAGFVLIEHVGIRLSLWATAAVNIGLGLAAIALSRPLAPLAATPPRPKDAETDPRAATLRRAALILLALTAFASLLDEIAWTRVLVMIVGGSTYAFTLILLVFLLGIGIGSEIVARRSTAPADTAVNAGLAQSLTALGAAVLFLVFNALAVFIISVFQVQYLQAGTRLLLMGGVVGLVVLVPAIGMGMTFPLLADLAAGRDRARAADVGLAYGLNTIGSIAGTVLTGFVLVVVLGTATTLRLGLLINAGAAIALAMLAVRGLIYGSPEHQRLRPRALVTVVLASLALGAAVGAPTWSSRLIDLGPTIYARTPMNAAELEAFLSHRGNRQLDYREGRNITVSVWENERSRSLKVSGKTDASDYGDMDTQIMAGLAPVAARPGARSAFVVGFGSGVTAGVLARVPGMEQVRVVELEPAVLQMGHYFRHVNQDVLSRPNVRVVVDDARSALQLTRDRFDVIVSEPSNPWLAGVATLYTPEFFRIARSRLNDDGVFCQWVQLYQLPLPVLAGIVRSIREVFPHVEVWFGNPVDVIVLASARPIHYDPAWLARLLGPGAPLADDGRDWLGLRTPADHFGRYLLGDSGVARLVMRAGLTHTDDRPELEFVAARRFLESQDLSGSFDSLLALRPATGPEGPNNVFHLARVLGHSSRALPWVDSARRLRPAEPEWELSGGRIRLATGDTAAAEAALTAVLRRVPREPDALLATALLAVRRGDAARARPLLQQALAAGADTARVWAAQALLAARDSSWSATETALRRTFAARRHTRAYAAAIDNLGEALSRFAQDGPAAAADTVLGEALALHPGWARLYDMRAGAALRAGNCEAAVDAFTTLLDFGIRRPDAAPRVARCLTAR